MIIDPAALQSLSGDALAEAVRIVEELDRRDRQKRIEHFFPDVTHVWRGQTYHARHLYPKHMEFFEATAKNREVGFIAANRVGKTIGGGNAMSYWLTGRYPHWWPGRRFERPIRAWAAGKTNESTRDVIQNLLLGDITYEDSGKRKLVDGTGLIPGDALALGQGQITWKQGVSDLVDTIKIRHVSGGYSTLGFKSYQQGRGAFEGTAQHVIWVDEEPGKSEYGEMVVRTATTNGLIMATFTPLEGMSDVVLSYMPSSYTPSG